MVCAPSILYVLWSMRRFETAFIWEKLPFQDLMRDKDTAFAKNILFGSYLQPELEDDSQTIISSNAGAPPIKKTKTAPDLCAKAFAGEWPSTSSGGRRVSTPGPASVAFNSER